MRMFDTGATRDSEGTKHDYEGFLSPLVIERFGEYMTSHRVQADGKLRASDNWQKGMPLDVYIKSLWRHFLDLWKLHRCYPTLDAKTGKPINIEDALCAIIFNVQGYLHEIVQARLERMEEQREEEPADAEPADAEPADAEPADEMCPPGTCEGCDRLRIRFGAGV